MRATELRRGRTDGRLVPLALDLYVRRAETIIRGNQRDSRHLAKAMFVENGLATWGRCSGPRRDA